MAIEEELRDLAYESLREVARSPDGDEAGVSGRKRGEATAAGAPGDREGDRRIGAVEPGRLEHCRRESPSLQVPCVRQRTLGGIRVPPRRHRHHHAAEVRDHLDTDDLRTARVPDAVIRHLARPDLAVARHADPRSRVGRRRSRCADAPALHQDPHTLRRTPVGPTMSPTSVWAEIRAMSSVRGTTTWRTWTSSR